MRLGIATTGLLLSICVVTCTVASDLTFPPAVPVDPITGVLDAFSTHEIVALGEGAHGNEQGFRYRLSLIRDPRFPSIVNDIVVESGNSLYQDTMDRFIRGETVSDAELRQTWQDTTQHNVWDVPIYEEFFRAVREVNATLDGPKKLRVLLGDPPIDWDKAAGPADLRAAMSQRDSYPVELIGREVLARKRHALVIYGSIHFLRKALYFPLPDREDAEKTYLKPLDNSIVSLLERRGMARVFSVWTATGVDNWTQLQGNADHWPIPSLLYLKGTQLGSNSIVAFNPGVKMFRVVDGENVGTNPDAERSHRMDEQFDALLYLGPGKDVTLSRLAPETCTESYIATRIRRMQLSWGGSGNAEAVIKGSCARAARR